MDSEPQYTYEEAICKTCAQPYQKRLYLSALTGKQIGSPICNPCWDAEVKEREEKLKREELRKREAVWESVCPLIYRNTDLNDQRLNKPAVSAVLRWEPRERKGLGLIGTTGIGKTRSLFMALRKAFDLDLSVAAISHTKLSRIAMDAYSGEKDERKDAREVLRELHQVEVVLLDDLGKPPSTDRADSELEELIEDRTSQGRAILWSANASGEWLIKRFGIDRGEPLVRRLAEFSDVTTL